MTATQDAIEDARFLFDSYVDTTKHIERCTGTEDPFLYPKGPSDLDMLVLGSVFTCLWQVIGNRTVFATHYASKQSAFYYLGLLTMPDTKHHKYSCFWEQQGLILVQGSVTTEDGMYSLCRTLRNGFGHFNYRYLDLSPDKYFAKLGVATPSGIRDQQTADNYRVFVCDHLPRTRLMDPGSNTRILETGFGHLRYHLYFFLARFFHAAGGREPLDLMTFGK